MGLILKEKSMVLCVISNSINTHHYSNTDLWGYKIKGILKDTASSFARLV